MLLEWITCTAVDVEAFGRGQRAWVALRGEPGFLGQFGGWGRREPAVAHIVGRWRDLAAYRAFKLHAHDPIAVAQAGTYRDLRGRLFEHCRDIGGGFAADVAGIALIRPAQGHAQAEDRTPGPDPGLLGGVVAVRGGSQFLVLSIWSSPPPGAAADLARTGADLVDLEPEWTVPPEVA